MRNGVEEDEPGERGRVELVGTHSPSPGDRLPDVARPSTAGGDVSPAEVAADRRVALVFYPGDREGLECPELMGCTPQACGVRDVLDAVRGLGAVVYGVSFQSSDRQRRFAERERLGYELLSDADERLATALGLPVWVADDGDRFVARTTVIARRGGEVAFVL